MATLEQLEARQKQIPMQIQKKRRALAAEERKARNHALMVIGGLVVQHAPDGDWKQIDMDALAAWIDRYGYKITECKAEGLPTADAAKRMRAWERKGREREEASGDEG